MSATSHPLQWVSPAPLWARFAADGVTSSVSADDQFRPALLRFAADDFMDQLLAILARDPKQLASVLARPETWRTPMDAPADLIERTPVPRRASLLGRLARARESKAAVKAVASVATLEETGRQREVSLKLYQPAHQRYYLVAADLVCQAAGFPLHAIATGGREQVGFVVRRMLVPLDPARGDDPVEHAFVKGAGGAQWTPVDGAALVDGEEMLPLFPMSFADDAGHPRRLLAGLVPVGRREEYMSTGYAGNGSANAGGAAGAGADGLANNTSAKSAHKEQLKTDVAEPWKNIIRAAWAMREKTIGDDNASAPPNQSLHDARFVQAQKMNRQLQMQSWLVLLDFADYLAANVPDVWNVIAGNAAATTLGSGTPAARLYQWLGAATMSQALMDTCVPDAATKPFAASLREALAQIPSARKGLEGAETLYAEINQGAADWPGFQFLLAGIAEDKTRDAGKGERFVLDGPYRSLSATSATPAGDDLDAMPGTVGPSADTDFIDKMVVLVVNALDLAKAAAAAPMPFAASLQRAFQDLKGDEGWFRIRCIHVRCDCGPLRPTLASAPSQQFQLASFFDPDAPARPIRIALPLDTTPAGLRKFNKNAALMVSDVLCGQIARAKGLGFIDLVLSVLPWPLHKDINVGEMGPCKAGSNNIGMICSLSIPIVTLAALILLLIIVSLLDFIFRWMPYLVMCFPIPGLKAKKP